MQCPGFPGAVPATAFSASGGCADTEKRTLKNLSVVNDAAGASETGRCIRSAGEAGGCGPSYSAGFRNKTLHRGMNQDSSGEV